MVNFTLGRDAWKISEKYKHMSLDDRIEIQEYLNKGMTFKAICKRIGKDQTTVSKKVKKHLIVYTNSFIKTKKCYLKLLKAPFVCNGCKKKNYNNCRYPKQKYIELVKYKVCKLEKQLAHFLHLGESVLQ